MLKLIFLLNSEKCLCLLYKADEDEDDEDLCEIDQVK